MSGMTIRQIAQLCGVSESTVRNWIDLAAASAVIAKPSAETAKASNTPFSFSLPDTLAIIRAGGNGTLADLLAENAQPKAAKLPKLPSGAQLHELFAFFKAGAVSKAHIRQLLGLVRGDPQAPDSVQRGRVCRVR